MQLRLTDAQVTALVDRTEGWAARLQLAGLALRDRPDPGAFVSAFAGGHRLVADYLSSEVLARQPPRTRRFLASTAGLDRLCAPLCDAVLDDGVGDGRTMLDELERANLFLVPLDEHRVWYRYHHLFADALRALLARDVGAAEAAVLHRRASRWFAREQLVPEAIQHALAAGAHDDAAAYLEALVPVLLGSVDIHGAVEGWLDALPDALVRSRPLLCLARAWLLIHRLEVAHAAQWAEAATRALPPDPLRIRGEVGAIRALLATLGPDASPDDACALAERALADLPAGDVPFRGVAGVAYGQAALARGQSDLAERTLTLAAEEGRAAGRVHGALVVAGHQVGVQRLRGARLRALAAGRAALAWAADRGGPAGPGLGVVSVLVADLLADGNEPADARALMAEGHRVLVRYRNAPPLVLLAALGLARLCLDEGDAPGAAAVLAEVGPLVAHGPYAALAALRPGRAGRARAAHRPAAPRGRTVTDPVPRHADRRVPHRRGVPGAAAGPRRAADSAGAGRVAAARRRTLQRRDGPRAHRRAEHGEDPPRAPLREAGRAQPHRGHRPGPRAASPRLSPPLLHLPVEVAPPPVPALFRLTGRPRSSESREDRSGHNSTTTRPG
jgi:LuxR family maltose regulon positive regulatory protein